MKMDWTTYVDIRTMTWRSTWQAIQGDSRFSSSQATGMDICTHFFACWLKVDRRSNFPCLRFCPHLTKFRHTPILSSIQPKLIGTRLSDVQQTFCWSVLICRFISFWRFIRKSLSTNGRLMVWIYLHQETTYIINVDVLSIKEDMTSRRRSMHTPQSFRVSFDLVNWSWWPLDGFNNGR